MSEQIPPSGGAPVPNQPPANWYPDPGTPGQMRYWDGSQWTANVVPAAGVASGVGPGVAAGWNAAPAAPVDPLDIPGGQPKVGFIRAIQLGFKQYVRFSGRSSRSEFWWWQLFYYLLSAVLLTPGYIQFFNRLIPAWTKFMDCIDANSNNTSINLSQVCKLDATSPPLLLLGSLLLLGLFLPSLAVAVRRLHDTGRSGWWYLLILVPFGAIVLIVFWALKSEPQPNKYGVPPHKGEPAAGTAVPSS
jgi:uncharacterized membrane protein YhaH (DUF805 family)